MAPFATSRERARKKSNLKAEPNPTGPQNNTQTHRPGGVCVACGSLCACATKPRFGALRASTLLRTPRVDANTVVTAATSPLRRKTDCLRRIAASHGARRRRRARQVARQPPRVGRSAHRDDATPMAGAVDAAVGSALLPPPPRRNHNHPRGGSTAAQRTARAPTHTHHSARGITREHAKPHQRSVLARRKTPRRH